LPSRKNTTSYPERSARVFPGSAFSFERYVVWGDLLLFGYQSIACRDNGDIEGGGRKIGSKLRYPTHHQGMLQSFVHFPSRPEPSLYRLLGPRKACRSLKVRQFQFDLFRAALVVFPSGTTSDYKTSCLRHLKSLSPRNNCESSKRSGQEGYSNSCPRPGRLARAVHQATAVRKRCSAPAN